MKNIFDELRERGVIAQTTDAEAIRELLGKGPVTFISVLIPRRTACM